MSAEIENGTRLNAIKSNVNYKNISKYIWSIVRAVFILGISYIILKPLLIKIVSSIRTPEDVLDPTVIWIPKDLNFRNYVIAFKAMDYPHAFLNSFSLTLLLSSLQLIVCTLIGYGFGRFQVKGNNFFFGLVIFTLIVPPQMIFIPMYLNFRFFDVFGLIPGGGINLLGTYWTGVLLALTGMGIKNGLFIYIMRQFFKGMPQALEEAAYVDGAGPFKTFYRIMLPGAIPALVVVFLFAFVWQWNDYFFTTMFFGGKNLLTNTLNGIVDTLVARGVIKHPNVSILGYIIKNTGSLMFLAPLIILYSFL